MKLGAVAAFSLAPVESRRHWWRVAQPAAWLGSAFDGRQVCLRELPVHQLAEKRIDVGAPVILVVQLIDAV